MDSTLLLAKTDRDVISTILSMGFPPDELERVLIHYCAMIRNGEAPL